MSVCTLTASNGSVCGSSYFSRRPFGTRKNHLIFETERQCIWHQWLRYLPFVSHSAKTAITQKRNLKVEAGWLFQRDEEQRGEEDLGAISEMSGQTNEDLLIFFYQLELTTGVQRALNMEQYDIAKQLRDRLTEVEAEFIRGQETNRGAASKGEAQDKAISILGLSVDLQNAIASENYSLATELKDKISKLDADRLAASIKAQAYENAQYVFRLGQKVKNKKFGYRAVVCGMDPVCCESKEWMEIAHVKSLTRGSNQPFYQVLVEIHEYPSMLVAYVPEENLLAPDQPDMDSLDNPYTSFLFYGMDAAGDYIPIKQLREKYNRPRHELPYDPQDEKTGEDA